MRLAGAAVVIVAGIAALVEATDHRPHSPHASYGLGGGLGTGLGDPGYSTTSSGLSHTAYDLLQIGGWALIVIGLLLAVAGLLRSQR